MTDYRVVANALMGRIEELRRLRDAQDPDGDLYARFQGDINKLTGQLLRIQDAGPRAEALDDRISAARAEVQEARDAAEDASTFWSRIALGTGGAGALLVVLSLLVSVPWWVPTIGALLLAATVGALFIGTKARASANADVDDAVRAVTALENEREELEPPPVHQALTTA